MIEQDRAGQIVTFYSFKGGVGRTMALANVAFLAAHGGLRVLMMDWDLDAPGLPYYFRGMRKSTYENQREIPGVLDLLWQWRVDISQCPAEGIEKLVQTYINGTPFDNCIRPIVDDQFLQAGARLDFIGAGSGQIKTPELTPYAEALAKFSWTSFFDNEAGGVVIENLRKWAKANYDLVLIDSRTGLADVAGVCTMQLPDQVALCLILNRQNIDGAAQVAAAIKAKRGKAIRIRTVPMRVASRGTSEESDARARAATELNQVGGIPMETVQLDLRLLDVAHADNVPFYEALAPFVPARATYDQLTLNYLLLTDELTGRKFKVPEINDDAIELVRGRLQPRTATIEYLRELHLADPTRAIEELRELLIGAEQSRANELQLTESYVRALVDAIFAVEDKQFDVDSSDLRESAINLMRHLNAADPVKWTALLLHCLEKHLDIESAMLDIDDELTVRAEIDLLLQSNQIIEAQLKRVVNLRAMAWLQAIVIDSLPALTIVANLKDLVHVIRESHALLSPIQEQILLAAEIHAAIVEGDVHVNMLEIQSARKCFEIALEKAIHVRRDSSGEDLLQLVSQTHQRLALTQLSSDLGKQWQNDAAFHALEAIRWSSTDGAAFSKFLPLLEIVANDGSPTQITEFCRRMFSADRKGFLRSKSTSLGRNSVDVVKYLTLLCQIVPVLYTHGDKETNELLQAIAASATQTLKNWFRRAHISRNPRTEEIDEITSTLQSELSAAKVPWTLPVRSPDDESARLAERLADSKNNSGQENE